MAVRAGPRLPPTLLAALAAILLPPWEQWLAALAAIVILGVPHGALDLAIGRTLLRPRWGLLWFPIFALPYLASSALVLAAWRAAPTPTLAAFLIASAWHFGLEHRDALGLPPNRMTVLALGGIPIAMPVLAQPAAAARLLSVISGAPIVRPPGWLLAAAIAWAGMSAPQGWRLWGVSAAPALACLWFALLPPIVAFALYFTALHAPAHVAALLRRPDLAPGATNAASAWRLALPGTLLTVAIGAALWPLYPGAPIARLGTLVFQGLAALTLPHMLLDAWLNRFRPGPPSIGRAAVPG